MATIIQSFPFFDQPMQFTCSLDGERHTAYIKYNFAGERWFIELYDSTNDLILCNPVIESSQELPNNLLAGYFAVNSMIYNDFTNAFELMS